MGRIGEQMSIYHASDNLTAGASLLGVDAATLARAEERAARAADVVLAVSRDLVERWSQLGVRVEYFPNAVDASAFSDSDTARPATDVTLPHPIAGVVGTLSERLDMDMLHAVADRMSLLLVGPESFRIDRSGFEALTERDGVQWVGPKPFESLGSYYRHIDIALVPYTLSAFNQGSFPLKTLEYLAVGKPVVSTRLRTIDGLRAPGVTFASTPAEFAVAALQQARGGASPESAFPLKAFAGQHDWTARATRLMEIAGEADHAI
jgi:teichuronic acid biosynthesis glycosyltransferase TuaH